MNKEEYIKKARIFLKMAEYDFTAMKAVRIAKSILSVALIINSVIFAVLFACGTKNTKENA